MMSHFESVREAFEELAYMHHREATIVRDLIVEHDSREILEIGFYHGKSSAYFAAILEDLGRGHLVTIDLETARARQPNIQDVLSKLGLEHRVTPVFAHRSYTWELGKMIRSATQPRFDLCYFDGGHTWDGTGFGFLLVDMLLRPGGLILFDDLEWTIDVAMRNRDKIPRHWNACDADERTTPAVRLVFDLLVPRLGYTDIRCLNGGKWGIARKSLDSRSARREPHAISGLRRMLTRR